MTSSKNILKVRPAELSPNTQERSFIYHAWQSGFKKSPFAGIIPNNLFSAVFDEGIQQLLERGMKVYVGEAEGSLVGFIAFEEAAVPVLHYVYVKPVLRGLGFFPALLEAAGISEGTSFLYTYRTPDCRKFKGGSHCPAIARRKNLEPIYAESPGKRG